MAYIYFCQRGLNHGGGEEGEIGFENFTLKMLDWENFYW